MIHRLLKKNYIGVKNGSLGILGLLLTSVENLDQTRVEAVSMDCNLDGRVVILLPHRTLLHPNAHIVTHGKRYVRLFNLDLYTAVW